MRLRLDRSKSRNTAMLRRMYADYASVAARPYARATWELLLRAGQRRAGQNGTCSHVTGLHVSDAARPSGYWERFEQVKPANVLTLLSDAPMPYVRGGTLHCKDDELSLRYERRAHKPLTIYSINRLGEAE